MQSKPQIFCFSYAGGTASFFDDISERLPEVEFIKLEYSGHGTRHREPLADNWDEMVVDLYQHMKDAYRGGRYALFGYSMGTISAVELLRQILQAGEFPAPVYVFLAAHEPRTKAALESYSNGEQDELVKERTIRFGAVPEALINNRSFWRLYLPLLRADYALIGKYRFDHLDLKTEIPLIVFYSESDTSFEEMKQWQRFFTGKCEFFPYTGTHFFIKEHYSEIAGIMKRKLCR